MEFGSEQMLGVKAPQGGHLGLQELAADGEGLGGPFPAFLKTQPHGGDGLAEVGHLLFAD